MQYAHMTSTVMKALDKVQGGHHAFLGCLLPTVAIAVMRLNDDKTKDLVQCSPPVDVVSAETKRFGLLEDRECQLTDAFHPRLHLLWLVKYDISQLMRVRKVTKTTIETASRLRETA